MRLSWNGTRSTRERWTQSSAKHLPEDMLHLLKSIISTTHVPNRSPVQKRLSIYNWNPGPRRGREGAIEKQIAGKWHIITLQEAIEKVDHELLTNRFHVTHYGGCAVLFSWDTFLPDIKVKSIHLDDVRHDLPDKVFDGESGLGDPRCYLKSFFSMANHLTDPTFTVMSLHINKNFAMKARYRQEVTLNHSCNDARRASGLGCWRF